MLQRKVITYSWGGGLAWGEKELKGDARNKWINQQKRKNEDWKATVLKSVRIHLNRRTKE